MFWWLLSEHSSIPEDVISHGVCLHCAIGIEGFLKVKLSIKSIRLVETLSPSMVFLFPYEGVGTLVKSPQFSS